MNNSKASLILGVVVGCFLLLLLVTYLVGAFFVPRGSAQCNLCSVSSEGVAR